MKLYKNYIVSTMIIPFIAILLSSCESSTTEKNKLKGATTSIHKVSWKSSKPSVATVDGNGKIEAISGGQAIITVTTDDRGHKASCKMYMHNVDLSTLKTPEITIDGQNGVSITKYTENKKYLVLPPVRRSKKVLEIEELDAFPNKQLTHLTIPGAGCSSLTISGAGCSSLIPGAGYYATQIKL